MLCRIAVDPWPQISLKALATSSCQAYGLGNETPNLGDHPIGITMVIMIIMTIMIIMISMLIIIVHYKFFCTKQRIFGHILGL